MVTAQNEDIEQLRQALNSRNELLQNIDNNQRQQQNQLTALRRENTLLRNELKDQAKIPANQDRTVVAPVIIPNSSSDDDKTQALQAQVRQMNDSIAVLNRQLQQPQLLPTTTPNNADNRLDKTAELLMWTQLQSSIDQLNANIAKSNQPQPPATPATTDAPLIRELQAQVSALQAQVESLKNRPVAAPVERETTIIQPPAPTPAPKPTFSEIRQIVFFDFGASKFKPASIGVLNKVAQLMQANPDTRLQAQGFTDSKGAANFNLRLSEERAQSVKNMLIQLGIDPDRITTIGMGEDAQSDAVFGRRVELLIRD